MEFIKIHNFYCVFLIFLVTLCPRKSVGNAKNGNCFWFPYADFVWYSKSVALACFGLELPLDYGVLTCLITRTARTACTHTSTLMCAR